MNTQERETLHELLRYHAGAIGAARLTVLGLESMIRAFEEVRATPQGMARLLDDLLQVVRDTRPKLIALIDLLMEFEVEVEPYFRLGDAEKARHHAIRLLKEKIGLYKEKMGAVTRHGLEHIQDGDTILVHSASSVVTDILIEATPRKRGKFKVLVLQLDPVRTPMVTRALNEEGIPHLIVPMHDLCHYQDEVDKLFIGALTVTPDRKIIAPKGTASVLSICHLAGIRSYLFANTLHYSKGAASTQQIHRTEEDRIEAATAYQMVSHSHDLVDLSLIDVVVNEFGVKSFAGKGPEAHKRT